MSKPRSNTKAIKLFAAYMAAKGTPVGKPVDVYRGVWSKETANDTKPVAVEPDVDVV
jgi:hypothetical protein